MSVPSQADCLNRILALLSAEDFASLAPHLEPLDLPKGFHLSRPDEPFVRVIFPEDGIASVVTVSPEKHRVEAGLFGREGVGPVSAVLGADTAPYEIIMQVPGSGHAIGCDVLRRLMDASPSLRSVFLHFAQVMLVQATYTALSNAIHTVDERLARWLLMIHDRLGSDDMALTHEFIAIMLAVRRPSVTTSLHVLEGNRFIRAERGHITIRDRRALEEFAHDAYGRPEAEYRRLIGPVPG